MKNTCRSTGPVTTGTLVATGRNMLNGVIIGGDGTNAATITVYDNTAASGTKLVELVLEATSDRSRHFAFDNPIVAEVGLYVDVAGTGATATVLFG